MQRLRRHRDSQLGGKRLQNRDVVTRLHSARYDQHTALRLVQRVLELRGAVSWIDVDQNGADASSAELSQQPLDTVRCPDADTIGTLHAQREQSRRHVIRAAMEIVP